MAKAPRPTPIGDAEPTPDNAAGVPQHLDHLPQTPNPQPTDPSRRPDVPTYQSRIRIVEAWRYPGSFAGAPAFIDRNWAAYAGPDEVRDLPAGPALRIPARTPSGEKLARAGDYVVRQSVTMAPELEPDEEIDIWPAEQFERLFMPSARPESSISAEESSSADAGS